MVASLIGLAGADHPVVADGRAAFRACVAPHRGPPAADSDLTHANMTVPTLRGTIAVAFERTS
jgi:hypothetical protein